MVKKCSWPLKVAIPFNHLLVKAKDWMKTKDKINSVYEIGCENCLKKFIG